MSTNNQYESFEADYPLVLVAPSDEDSTDMSVNSLEEDQSNDPIEQEEEELLIVDVVNSPESAVELGDNQVVNEQEANYEEEPGNDEMTQPLSACAGTIAQGKKDEPEEYQPSPLKLKLHNESSVDDDGQICMICFEPWTNSNVHRLVSLRCGHLFGRSCISKWLRGQGSRCPQCNARARKSEIRPIYARCLKALDTTERDEALRELEKESELRKKAELECAQMRLKYQMAVQQYELTKKELIETKMLLNETRLAGMRMLLLPWKKKRYLSSSQCIDKLPKIAKPTATFHLSSNINLQSGCRIMDCNDMLGMMVVSQPSCNQIFKGFGLRKISIPDMKQCEYVHLHQKPIKDISFHNNNGLILTASLDKTLKLTNCLNNSLVQTYNLDCEAWSCAWDLDDPCYFYAGIRTGVVYIFDIRTTDRHVEELTGFGELSPVISLQYVKRQPSSSRSQCGLLVGQLASCMYYQKHYHSSYESNQIPLEGKFTSLSYEPTTNHLLASTRPSSRHPCVTHTLCELAYEDNKFRCNLVQSLSGGSSQAQLTRSKLIPHPNSESSVLVCAGDEDAQAALIWDGSTGELVDSLSSDSPVLDVTTFHEGHKTTLATLSEKNLRIYNWA